MKIMILHQIFFPLLCLPLMIEGALEEHIDEAISIFLSTTTIFQESFSASNNQFNDMKEVLDVLKEDLKDTCPTNDNTGCRDNMRVLAQHAFHKFNEPEHLSQLIEENRHYNPLRIRMDTSMIEETSPEKDVERGILKMVFNRLSDLKDGDAFVVETMQDLNNAATATDALLSAFQVQEEELPSSVPMAITIALVAAQMYMNSDNRRESQRPVKEYFGRHPIKDVEPLENDDPTVVSDIISETIYGYMISGDPNEAAVFSALAFANTFLI